MSRPPHLADPAPFQRWHHEQRLHREDAAWEEERLDYLVAGEEPTWLGVGLSLAVVVLGLLLLVPTLTSLVAGGPVLRAALVLGSVLPVAGVYYAVRIATLRLRYVAAEEAYLARRSALRLHDSPRRPDPAERGSD